MNHFGDHQVALMLYSFLLELARREGGHEAKNMKVVWSLGWPEKKNGKFK